MPSYWKSWLNTVYFTRFLLFIPYFRKQFSLFVSKLVCVSFNPNRSLDQSDLSDPSDSSDWSDLSDLSDLSDWSDWSDDLYFVRIFYSNSARNSLLLSLPIQLSPLATVMSARCFFSCIIRSIFSSNVPLVMKRCTMTFLF